MKEILDGFLQGCGNKCLHINLDVTLMMWVMIFIGPGKLRLQSIISNRLCFSPGKHWSRNENFLSCWKNKTFFSVSYSYFISPLSSYIVLSLWPSFIFLQWFYPTCRFVFILVSVFISLSFCLISLPMYFYHLSAYGHET